MASSKQGETSAAADQLGSMSVSESAERKDENNEGDQNEAPAKMCSACDKKSDTLMKCRACKCVWYCDKDCQNKHWKEHKKECRRIKKELDKRGGKLDDGEGWMLGPLGKLPQREECPICMRVLPIVRNLQVYEACCGKNNCGGCYLEHKIQIEKRANTSSTEQPRVFRFCAFCRTTQAKDGKETLARLRKRIEHEDPQALYAYAMAYGYGHYGLPVNQAKCIDLLRQSADLGFPVAHYQLGNFHETGEMRLEQNKEETLKHWKKAAEGGHLISRHNLGCEEGKNGDDVAALDHWRLSASGGMRASMNILIRYFEDCSLHHADLAETLQAFYRSRAEMKSKDRDLYIEHLKKTGEYRDHFDP